MAMQTNSERPERGLRPGVIAGGAILLVVGGTMFLDRTGMADVPIGRMIGPAFLILVGMAMLVERGKVFCGARKTLPDGTSRRPSRRRDVHTGGLWLLGVGSWMLISQLHLFGLDYHTSWPLLIILSG